MRCNKTLRERFWLKVVPDPKSDCLLWTGATVRGYGHIRVGYAMRRANRVAWFLAHGRWPRLNVLHKCDRPLCVNINHLFLGTPADNSADMVRKGRCQFGEKHRNAKLSARDIIAIRGARQRGQETTYQIAKRYGVSQPTVSDICIGRTWRSVKEGLTCVV